jgi:hypothetical protein
LNERCGVEYALRNLRELVGLRHIAERAHVASAAAFCLGALALRAEPNDRLISAYCTEFGFNALFTARARFDKDLRLNQVIRRDEVEHFDQLATVAPRFERDERRDAVVQVKRANRRVVLPQTYAPSDKRAVTVSRLTRWSQKRGLVRTSSSTSQQSLEFDCGWLDTRLLSFDSV